jgi:hypothetical protein
MFVDFNIPDPYYSNKEKVMISISQISRQYGYDESTVREWKAKGMPHGKTIDDAITISWIVDHVIKPLRDTDTKSKLKKNAYVN